MGGRGGGSSAKSDTTRGKVSSSERKALIFDGLGKRRTPALSSSDGGDELQQREGSKGWFPK